MGLLKNIRDSFKKSKEEDTVKNDNIVETTGNNSLAGNDEMKNNFEEYVRISKEQKEQIKQIENYFAEDYESAKKSSEELEEILEMQEDKMNEYNNNQRQRMNNMFNSDFAKRTIKEAQEIASKKEKTQTMQEKKEEYIDAFAKFIGVDVTEKNKKFIYDMAEDFLEADWSGISFDFKKKRIDDLIKEYIGEDRWKDVYISRLKDCGVDEKSAMDLYEVKELFNSIKINKNYDQIEVAKKLLMHFFEKNVNLLSSIRNKTMVEHGDNWNYAQKEIYDILVEGKELDKEKEISISNKKNEGYSTDDYEGR